jgi:ATP phosphoribosyltransferase
MRAAGLKAIDTVVESTAVLVKNRNTQNPLVDLITSRIRGVISMTHPFRQRSYE